jgi:NADH-quinone oxidoreductase subunit L
VTEVLNNWFEPVFEESPLSHIHPSVGDEWLGAAVGGLVSISGIALAYWLWVANAGVTVRLAERFRALHAFLLNKWYFDELYDAVVYRPVVALGKFLNDSFERVVVQGLVGGTVGLVRGASGVVRGAQSGFVRAYALLVVMGFAALGIYFLAVSS